MKHCSALVLLLVLAAGSCTSSESVAGQPASLVTMISPEAVETAQASPSAVAQVQAPLPGRDAIMAASATDGAYLLWFWGAH